MGRPWFGPKRIGIGYRPQTWQSWLIILVGVAVVVAVVLTLHGH